MATTAMHCRASPSASAAPSLNQMKSSRRVTGSSQGCNLVAGQVYRQKKSGGRLAIRSSVKEISINQKSRSALQAGIDKLAGVTLGPRGRIKKLSGGVAVIKVERQRELGIEDDRGCSKEDMANALVEVYEGRLPEDRLVLRELAKEMLAWPRLEEEISGLNPAASPYAKMTPTGVDPKVSAQRARVDWDAAAEIQPGEEQKDLSDMVPPAVGFSFLYLVSFIPVIIVVAVVLILFFNSAVKVAIC